MDPVGSPLLVARCQASEKTASAASNSPTLHPTVITNLLNMCLKNDIIDAINLLCEIYQCGYTPIDIIETLFQICSNTELLQNTNSHIFICFFNFTFFFELFCFFD